MSFQQSDVLIALSNPFLLAQLNMLDVYSFILNVLQIFKHGLDLNLFIADENVMLLKDKFE